MPILQIQLPFPNPFQIPRTLSFARVLSLQTPLLLQSKPYPKIPTITTTIRMGGGPRTFPGGVSKWQWKRMQAKKSKQLLKARLSRERQIYEMRKRAELKAAVSELERPWEAVQKAPTLFSVGADEQLKVLADRFQKPGGFDMWSDRDGPQLFDSPGGVRSSSGTRFFPKGVVHSVKTSRRINGVDGSEKLSLPGDHLEDENGGKMDKKRIGSRMGKGSNVKVGKWRGRRKFEKENRSSHSTENRSNLRNDSGFQKLRGSKPEVYDMVQQKDGSYEL